MTVNRERRALPPRVAAIAEQIAMDHGFTLDDLIGLSRRHDITRARNAAYAALSERIKINGSPPSHNLLGQWFGGRDRTTIRFGLERAALGFCRNELEVS